MDENKRIYGFVPIKELLKMNYFSQHKPTLNDFLDLDEKPDFRDRNIEVKEINGHWMLRIK